MGQSLSGPKLTIRWVIYSAFQVLFIWGAIAAYRGMNSDGYEAGNWALIFVIPFAALPGTYGIFLLEDSIKYVRSARTRRQVRPPSDEQLRLLNQAQAAREQAERDTWQQINDK